MQLKTIEDIQEFQEESQREFQENLESYLEREEQARKDFNAFIYKEEE